MNEERNLRLFIEYDGTCFHGWQWQPALRTVQGTIETALRQLLQERVTLIGAGRTDAGVHAVRQVANVHISNRLSTNIIQRGLNALTPDDIVIHGVDEVPSSFHARFDAKKRVYRYQIATAQRAIGRTYQWYVPCRFLLHRMQEAVTCLVGRHDFSAFALTGGGERSRTCTVFACEWSEQEDEVVFDMTADRFLRGMVRTIVGTSVEIGRGRWPVERMQEAVQSVDSPCTGPTAPAHGLCLMDVVYD
ncbi:MAG: tRNA pseudouridine(38-40) synthase TruA [Candidatus Latescibacteria bacterium]|nr:tRNA pseudouridine(38-40) synthase TruA [Candidatus Latescibacterota bacterium]